MGRLLHLELENFKSYKGNQMIGPFDPSFTCIIGPNGAGKSNLMDALSFVFGISSQHLRSLNLKELIYHQGVKIDQSQVPAEKDENSLIENIEPIKSGKRQKPTASIKRDKATTTKEKDTGDDPSAAMLRPETASVHAHYETTNGEKMVLTRKILATGSSEYRLNNKTVPFSDYCTFLESENILIKARNFLVFQGDIEYVSCKSPMELTKLFEQISGSDQYRDEYDRLKSELEFAIEASAQAFARKKAMTNELRLAKEQQAELSHYEELLLMRDDLLRDQVLLSCKKLELERIEHEKKRKEQEIEKNNLENEIAELEKEMKSMKKQHGSYTLDQIKSDKSVKKANQLVADLRTRIGLLAESIKLKQEKLGILESSLSELTLEYQAKENILVNLQEELEKLANITIPIKISDNNLADIPEDIVASYKVFKESLAVQMSELSHERDAIQRSLEPLLEKTREMDHERQLRLSQRNRAVQDKIVLTTRRESLLTEQQHLEKSLKDEQHEKDQLLNVIRQRANLESSLSVSLKDTLQKILVARIENRATEKEKRAKHILTQIKRQFPAGAVLGRLKDLITPTSPVYETALRHVLGKHLQSVVVDKTTTAIACISFLKQIRGGMMTFLPMDALSKSVPNLDSLRAAVAKRETTGKGNVDSQQVLLAIDAIALPSTNSSPQSFSIYSNPAEMTPSTISGLRNVVSFCAGKTLITGSLQIARQLKYNSRYPGGSGHSDNVYQKVKMVTLEGSVLHKSGLIEGGRGVGDDLQQQAGQASSVGSTWQDASLDSLKNAREKLLSSLHDLMAAKKVDSSSLEKINTALANLEEKLRMADSSLVAVDLELTGLNNTLSTLDDQLASLDAHFNTDSAGNNSSSRRKGTKNSQAESLEHHLAKKNSLQDRLKVLDAQKVSLLTREKKKFASSHQVSLDLLHRLDEAQADMHETLLKQQKRMDIHEKLKQQVAFEESLRAGIALRLSNLTEEKTAMLEALNQLEEERSTCQISLASGLEAAQKAQSEADEILKNIQRLKTTLNLTGKTLTERLQRCQTITLAILQSTMQGSSCVAQLKDILRTALLDGVSLPESDSILGQTDEDGDVTMIDKENMESEDLFSKIVYTTLDKSRKRIPYAEYGRRLEEKLKHVQKELDLLHPTTTRQKFYSAVNRKDDVKENDAQHSNSPPSHSISALEERYAAIQDAFVHWKEKVSSLRSAFQSVKSARKTTFMNAFEKVKIAVQGIYQALTRLEDMDPDNHQAATLSAIKNNSSASAYLLLTNGAGEIDGGAGDTTGASGSQHFEGISSNTISSSSAEEPYLCGILFHVMPPLKPFRPMESLSGGEKSMAALALLFAFNQIKPAPLMILDEVDAALDIPNVLRLVRYLENQNDKISSSTHTIAVAGNPSYSTGVSDTNNTHHSNSIIPTTQYIVISLKRALFERASSLIGIYKSFSTIQLPSNLPEPEQMNDDGNATAQVNSGSEKPVPLASSKFRNNSHLLSLSGSKFSSNTSVSSQVLTLHLQDYITKPISTPVVSPT